jgi:YD repeat-containing protein
MLQGALEGAEDAEPGDHEYAYDEDGNLTGYIKEGFYQEQLDEQQPEEEFPGDEEGKRMRPAEVRIISDCFGACPACTTLRSSWQD